MNKKLLVIAIVLIAGVLAAAAPEGMAAKKEPANKEMLSAPQYPGSIEARATGMNSAEEYRATFYTNDTIDKVKAYYEQKTGVRISVQEGSGKGCRDVSFTNKGKKFTEHKCIFIQSKSKRPEPFDELEEVVNSSGPSASSPAEAEFLKTYQKYKYLAEYFFPIPDGGSGKTVMQELYDKHMNLAHGKINAESKQQSKEKTAKAQKKNTGDTQSKKEERKKTQEKIKQLKKEGRNDEAMALTMQMMQENQGVVAQALEEGSENQAIETENDAKLSDIEMKARISFLEELAKQPSYKTQIIIEYLTGETSGG